MLLSPPNGIDPSRPASSTAHRYWRIMIDENYNDTYLSIAAIEMGETSGGAVLASAAFAISGGDRGTCRATGQAFDGDTGTAWSILRSAGAVNLWIGQDFGTAYDLRELRLTARAAGFYTHMPTSFAVVCSMDGVFWQVTWVETDVASRSAAEQRAFVRPSL